MSTEQAIYFEDLCLGAIRVTSGRTLTETDFVVHAGHTGDFYPNHVDAVFAAGTEFGQRIAHGTLVFAIGVGMTATVINPHAFSYGYDKVRFIKPVFIGDTIRSQVTVVRVEDLPTRPGQGRMYERLEVLNQNDQVVLACEHIYIVKRRKSSACI